MPNRNRSDCRGAHYCGHHRTCERCARRRAALIADRAQYLEQRHGALALAVAKPEHNTAQAIKRLRDQLMRAKLAPAGIWTIETGERFAGLHLNMLVPQRDAAALMGRVEYIEDIRTSSRAAAAYICKRSGMPPPSQYDGRLHGEWGNVVQHIMASHDVSAAPAQAAAVNMALLTQEERDRLGYWNARSLAQQRANDGTTREKTRAEYAEIARRNLAAVYLACASGAKTPDLKKPEFQQGNR